MFRRATLSVLPMLLLFACPSGPRGAGSASGSGDTRVTLLWTWTERGDELVTTTRWLADDGSVVAEQPALVVAAGTRLWTWKRDRVQLEECDCACLEGDETGEGGVGEGAGAAAEGGAPASCAARADGTHAALVELGGAGRFDLSPAQGGDCDEGLGSIVCPAFPLGGVGPYLFVAHACHMYFCGAAHGDTTWQFQVIDVTTGTPTPLVSDAEKAALFAGAEQAARAAFQPEPGDEEAPPPPEDVRLTLFHPRIVGTKIVLALQLTGDVPYAFSDGLWDAYSASVQLDAATLPAALVPFADVPPAAAKYLAAHPPGQDDVVGYSTLVVPSGKTEVFRNRFAGR